MWSMVRFPIRLYYSKMALSSIWSKRQNETFQLSKIDLFFSTKIWTFQIRKFNKIHLCIIVSDASRGSVFFFFLFLFFVLLKKKKRFRNNPVHFVVGALTSYCASVVFWLLLMIVGSIRKAGVPIVDSIFVAATVVFETTGSQLITLKCTIMPSIWNTRIDIMHSVSLPLVLFPFLFLYPLKALLTILSTETKISSFLSKNQTFFLYFKTEFSLIIRKRNDTKQNKNKFVILLSSGTMRFVQEFH